MKRIPVVIFSILMATLGLMMSSSTAYANVVNGGFETGTLAGWNGNNGLSNVVTSYVATNGSASTFQTMLATEGNHFATLTAGGGQPVTTLTSDVFTVNAGDTISFDWFTSLEGPYQAFQNDGFALSIMIGGQAIPLAATLLTNTAGLGDYGLADWANFSFTSTVSGSMNLLFYSLSGSSDLTLGVDNVQVTAVPLPTAAFMMLLAFASLVPCRRSQATAQA